MIPSSTTPTLPLTPATADELLPMTMTVHRLHHATPSDIAIAQSRIREFAIAAENQLHDDGVISIVNSDSMGMGRAAEVLRRTLQLQAGKLADIVLWNPARFGATPEIVIKSGFVAWGASGSGSGSTRLTQPIVMGPFFGGLGGAPARLSRVFVSGECLADTAARAALPPGIRYAQVRDSRSVSKASMVRNAALAHVVVPAEAAPVLVDGAPVAVHRAESLPLTRAFLLG